MCVVCVWSISFRPLTTEARVRSWLRSIKIFGEQSGTATGFSLNISDSALSITLPMLHTHHHPQLLLPDRQGAKPGKLSKSNALSEVGDLWIYKCRSSQVIYAEWRGENHSRRGQSQYGATGHSLLSKIQITCQLSVTYIHIGLKHCVTYSNKFFFVTGYFHLHAERPPVVSCTEILYSIYFQLPSTPARRLLQVPIENESCLVDKGRHLTCRQLAINSDTKRYIYFCLKTPENTFISSHGVGCLFFFFENGKTL
jgi:hypothetical protein